MLPHILPGLLLALAGSGLAKDVLYSSRIAKRGLDQWGHFNISFLHVNDVHAHLDQYAASGTECTEPTQGCFGGYARIKNTVDRIRAQHGDSLLLNAGDEFQGTMFYSFYKGEKIGETLNLLNFDAMTIGNHEFDAGDDLLGDFFFNLTFPVISANIVSDNLKLNQTIRPYVVFKKQQLAVIGATTKTTPDISSPGPGTHFLDVVESVQRTINHIRSTTNITRIVALTHIGYSEDQRLAEATTGLYLIIGGHSHTLLGDMESAEGKYPTIVKNKDGDEVFVVTSYRWGEYLGYIDVAYDDEGKILAYHGGPIHMDSNAAMDETLQARIQEWRESFEAYAAEVIGETKTDLDQTRCQKSECLLGDVLADAILKYRQKKSQGNTRPSFALVNAGGVRATIGAGNITRGQILTAFPFSNAVGDVEISGKDLWKTLEGVVSKRNLFNDKPISSFIQVSRGIEIVYNPREAKGSRLVSVHIESQKLDEDKTYRFVTMDFVARGGDNILVPFGDFAPLDTEEVIVTDYVERHSPLDVHIEGRIREIDTPSNNTRGSNGMGISGWGNGQHKDTNFAPPRVSQVTTAADLGIGGVAAVPLNLVREWISLCLRFFGMPMAHTGPCFLCTYF